VANTLDLFRNGAVGFIDWLGLFVVRENADKNSISWLWRTGHRRVLAGRTIEIANRNAKDPSSLLWVEAPLSERTDSSIIKDMMTGALFSVDARNMAIRTNV